MWERYGGELICGITITVVTIALILGITLGSYNSTKLFVENNYCYETLAGQDAAVWVKCDVKPRPKQGE